MTRRVLVTGASGFVGRRTLEALLRRGYDVHAISRRPPAASGRAAGAPDRDDVRWHEADLLDSAQRRAVVAEAGASHLLHLAWFAEPGAFWTARENATWVGASIDLLDAFVRAGGVRAVVAGTCAEYDWSASGPLREDAEPEPGTFYGVCKDATRRVAQGLAARADVELAWGRIFFLYGPHEDARRLVASVARALLAGERAATTSGTQIRDFLHVDDAAGAFAALVDGGVRGTVNVGSGAGVAVREVVELVARAAGRPDLLDVGARAQTPGDPAAIIADVGRLRDELGFVPAIGLEQGIRATVAWWREQGAGFQAAP